MVQVAEQWVLEEAGAEAEKARAAVAALTAAAAVVAGRTWARVVGRQAMGAVAMAAMVDTLPDAEFWRVDRAAHAPFISHEKPFADRVAAFAWDCAKPGRDA